MSMRVKLEDDEGVEVQMAPLIDCMFLLLIFFLVATTLKEVNREVPVELPYADAAVEVTEDPNLLSIGIDLQGGLYVNGTPANRQLVIDHLREAHDRGLQVRLDADRSLAYESVLEIIELCHIQGIPNVGLHTRDSR